MKIITLVVSFALFAFCAPAALRASGLVVEKWKYDPETKILSLKLVNTSGKLITGYGWSVIHSYADGTTDALPDGQPSGGSSAEMLSGWIDDEMRKVGLRGDRAERGELGRREARHVVGVRMRIGDAIELGSRRGGGDRAWSAEMTGRASHRGVRRQ